MTAIGLEVLHEDAQVLVVSKPPCLLTQARPGSAEPSLEAAVRRHLGPDAYLGTVHRLDRGVSGVVVWAKTEKAARRLSGQFAQRETVKEYWAVLELLPGSAPLGPRGTWDDWLTESTGPTGVVRRASPGMRGARRAVTRFDRAGVEPPEATSLAVRLWPETGRTHQLRAQSAFRGLPVVGDSAYGSTRAFPAGIALHARSLTFEHPTSRRRVSARAPIPAAWEESGFASTGERDPRTWIVDEPDA